MESFYGAEILAKEGSFRLVLQDLSVLCSGLEWLIKSHDLSGLFFTVYAVDQCRLEKQKAEEDLPEGFERSPIKRLKALTEHGHLEPADLGVADEEWLMLFSAERFTVLAAALREGTDINVRVSLDPDIVRQFVQSLPSELLSSQPILKQIVGSLPSRTNDPQLACQFALRVMERQQAEIRATAHDENRIFRLAEQSLDLIYRIQLKPHFQILYISPIVETWMGCTREQLYQDARIAFHHIHPQDVLELKRMMVEEKAAQGRSVVRFLPASREPFWIEHRWFVDRSTDRSVIVLDGVGRDITRQKRQEEAISEALLAAEDNARSKSLFLANMSHEIRTPLNAIIGQVDLLKRTSVDAEQSEMLDSISAAGQILLSHLTDVLDFSRLDAQRVKLQPSAFSLVGALSDALNLVKEGAREKGLALRRHFDRDVPGQVIGDRAKVVQLVVNLLSNAVKFTESGEVGLDVHCDQVADDGVRAVITVSDTGVGFPEEHFWDLLQPFSQADPSNSRKQEGAGLGLAIVSRLVELMDGTLSAQSAPGKGSAFLVEIPLSIEPGALNWASCLGDSVVVLDSKPTFSVTPTFAKTAGVEMGILETLGLLSAESKKRLQVPGDPDAGDNGMTLPIPMGPDAFVKALLPTAPILTGRAGLAIPADLRILVVEDNEVNRKVIGRQLRALGLENVDYATNGQEALQVFSPARYGLVLMDIQMPILDGVQTLKALKEAYPGLPTPIIAITAHALPGDRETYLESGFRDYISKPVRIDELQRVLLECLSSL